MSDQIICGNVQHINAPYDAVAALKPSMTEGVVDFKPKADVMVKRDDKGNISDRINTGGKVNGSNWIVSHARSTGR